MPNDAGESVCGRGEGKIKKVVIAEPGAGYSSPPELTVKSFEKARLEAKLKFTTDLKKNGGVETIDVAKEKSSVKNP